VFGKRCSTYVVGPTDLDDHVEHYTGCMIRDHYGKLKDRPDVKSEVSAWHTSHRDRMKCFYNKELFILDSLQVARGNTWFKLLVKLRIVDIPDLCKILKHSRNKIFTEKNIESITSNWGRFEIKDDIDIWWVDEGIKQVLLQVHENKIKKEHVLRYLTILRNDLGI
jgi:hypothetical protein